MLLADLLGLNNDADFEAVRDAATALTRGELVAAASALASELQSMVPPGARVGLVTSSSVRSIVDLLAALLSNRSVALLPVDGLGSDDPSAVGRSTNCSVLLRNGTGEVVEVENQAFDTTAGLSVADSPERVLLFTSGTTSRPRGVRLSDANVVAHLTAMLRTAVPWGSDDRVGQTLTLSHSFGLSMALLALVTRTPLTMLPDGVPGRRLAEAMDVSGITVYACVPYFLRLLSTRGIDLGGATAPNLRHLYLAGGGVSDQDLASLLPHYTGETYLMYGLTEATARVAVRRGRDTAPSNSVGLPLPGVHVRIVNETGDPLAPGSAGRIQVFSPTLMIGYLGEAPRAYGEPITTTDVGHLDAAGNLFIEGRQAEMMNFRGNRVSLVAVEALVCGIDGVTEARVKPAADQDDAPAELQIVPSGAADTRRIRREALRVVVPRGLIGQVTFVEALPKTRSGKAIRH